MVQKNTRVIYFYGITAEELIDVFADVCNIASDVVKKSKGRKELYVVIFF